jgi:hypothetical protein
VAQGVEHLFCKHEFLLEFKSQSHQKKKKKV